MNVAWVARAAARWADRKIKEFIRDSLGFSIILISLLALLHDNPLLSHLEATTVKITSVLWGALSEDASSPSRPGPGIRTVVIPSRVYESDFGQVSPLDRRKLHAIISTLADAKPGVLAIDLDLSPGPPGDPRGGEENLENLLAAQANAGLAIVLITPQPVLDRKMQADKFAWMRRLCDAGVRFGLPHLAIQDGVVLRFDDTKPILAKVAYRASRGQAPTEDEPCKRTEKEDGFARAVFLDLAFEAHEESGGRGKFPLINAEYLFGLSDRLTIALDGVSPPQLEAVRAQIPNGSRVVLGGAYGEGDRHMTVQGERYGVLVHAAQLASLVEGTLLPRSLAEYLNPVVHLLAGFLYGLVMGAAWRKAIAGQLQIERVTQDLDRRRGARNLFFGYSVLLLWAAFLLLVTCLLTVWGLALGVELDLGAVWFGFFVESARVASSTAVEEGIKDELVFQRAAIQRRVKYGMPDKGEQKSIEAVLGRLKDRHRDRLAERCGVLAYFRIRVRMLWRETRRDWIDVVGGGQSSDGRIVGARLLALGAIGYKALVLALFFAAVSRLVGG